MPRYPSVVKSRFNVNLAPLGSALSGDAQAEDNIPGSAEGETSELAGTQASKYPHYKSPSFWQKLTNPEMARDIEKMNYESSVREASDAAELGKLDRQTQNQIKVKQFDLDQQALKNVLKREGLPDEQVQRVLDSHSNEVLNAQKFKEATTEQQKNLAENEPEVLYGNEKAKLLRPGVENRSVGAATEAQTIKNQFLPQREPAEIEHINALTSGVKQGTEQKGLLFPFEQEQEKNKAINSGMIRIPSNEVVGNVPSAIGDRPINWFSVTPEQKQIQGGLALQPSPADPSKMVPSYTPTTPAQAPFLNSIGTLNNLRRPINGPDQTGTSTTDPYEYRTDPVTGKTQRRPRNPSTVQ